MITLTAIPPETPYDGELHEREHGDDDDAGQGRARDEVERVRQQRHRQQD